MLFPLETVILVVYTYTIFRYNRLGAMTTVRFPTSCGILHRQRWSVLSVTIRYPCTTVPDRLIEGSDNLAKQLREIPMRERLSYIIRSVEYVLGQPESTAYD